MSVKIMKGIRVRDMALADVQRGDILVLTEYEYGREGQYYVVVMYKKRYEIIAEFPSLNRAVRYAVLRDTLPRDIKEKIHLDADNLIEGFLGGGL